METIDKNRCTIPFFTLHYVIIPIGVLHAVEFESPTIWLYLTIKLNEGGRGFYLGLNFTIEWFMLNHG